MPTVVHAQQTPATADSKASVPVRRYLYVATPGIRNYLEYGGHGLIVFDMDQGHTFLKRIPFAGLGADGKPLNVKGICANASTQRLYVSTLEHLICVNLVSGKVLWERSYEQGCDRMSMTPDGRIIYLPSLEKDHWKVVDAASGDVITKIVTDSGAHNTVMSRDGKFVYLAGLRSPFLTVVDTSTHQIVKQIGPFANSIRPFTVDGNRRRCYVNINELLGFEVGDLESGEKLMRVEVAGYQQGPVKRHGCPSHGIGMSPNGKEIWVSDGANSRVHVFDITAMPPRQVASIPLRDQPGWVTFSLDGTLAYPSSGEVIDTQTRQIVATLTDEDGRAVGSEKLLEIDFINGKPVRAGDQFGVGEL